MPFTHLPQCTKEVVSDSPGLVDFAIGLLIFVLNLPDGQVLFLGEIHITEGLYINPANPKGGFGAVEMTCGLTHASYSLPEWQAAKLTLFAPCPIKRLFAPQPSSPPPNFA